ncbi:outer membrane protein assembly factor BamA [Candidatus Pseudomonas adelgestsugas]|nr:outer membrane protein assembly factor BamA [Candidatus Pseudomonas adelgestsugas]
MKRMLLTVVITVLMIFEVHAESFTISDIRINGLQRVSVGSVLGVLPLHAGEHADDYRLVESTRVLFKTGFFQDIQLGREGNVLVIKVIERPSVASIELQGSKAISTEDLMNGLKQSGIAEGELFQGAALDRMCNELQRQYVARGRYSASIKTEVVPQPYNRVILKIMINEGAVAAIHHINVVGNTKFTDDELVSLFELKATNWLSFLKNDDRYIREKLSGDLESLRSYYLDHGYINMDIIATHVSITPDKKHIYITVNINEGERYTVRDVKLSSDLKIPEDQVHAMLLMQKYQVFSRKLMTATSELITRHLGNEGYIFANVSGVPTLYDYDHTVGIVFVVNPGRRVYVNRINFYGNTRSADEVLRREMRQMEGSLASTYLIDQSKIRLERLGFFKEVNVKPQAIPGIDDQIDVNYVVEEQASGSITASVGFAQSAGLILGGSISQNNFLGTGNKVSIGLTRSEYQSRYNFSYLDPYWTTDGVSFGYNAFYRTTDYKNLDVDVASYAIDSFGAGVNIGYPISETSRFIFGFTEQHDQIKTGVYTMDEIFNFMRKDGDQFLNFKASAGWSESTLNKGVLATRGHSQSLTMETTMPGSDLSFFKLDYRGQLFQPLSDHYTMRLHAELGYGNGYGSTSSLPFYENYYAGGFNSVRGFKDSTLGPRGTPSRGQTITGNIGTRVDSNNEPLPFGGNILIQSGAEILFPLPFVKDQHSVRTSVFWDVGNVFDSKCEQITNPSGVKSQTDCNDISLSNLTSSVGVGMTWVTAIGPLSFALAVPIKKSDHAETQIFQFSFGQTF